MLSSRAFTVAGPAPVQTVESVEVIAVPEMLPQAPQWSPDAAWLSFSGARGTGIGLVRPDGAGLHWLSREPGEGWRHAWSPDRALIVSRSRRAGPEMRQFVIRVISAARGAEGSRLEAGGEVQPPFWQSGKEGMRWICQDGESARTGPWLIPATGGSENAVPRPPLLHYRGLQPGRMTPEGFAPLLDVRAQDPHWNAAGNQAAVDASDRIAFWDGTSAAERVLAPGQQPALSPDGGWIAYQLTRDHNHAPASSQAHTPDTMPHLHSSLTALAIFKACADFPGVDLTAPVTTAQTESVAVAERDRRRSSPAPLLPAGG